MGILDLLRKKEEEPKTRLLASNPFQKQDVGSIAIPRSNTTASQVYGFGAPQYGPQLPAAPRKPVVIPTLKKAASTGVFGPVGVAASSPTARGLAAGILQSPQRTIASAGIQAAADITELATGRKIDPVFQPKPGFQQAVLGKEPIVGITEQVDRARAKSQAGLESIGFSEDASTGASLALAPLFVGGLAALEADTGIGGGGKGAQKIVEDLVVKYGDDALLALRALRSGDRKTLALLSEEVVKEASRATKNVKPLELSEAMKASGLAKRSLPQTIKESPKTAEEVVARIPDQLYVRKSNAVTLEEGKLFVEEAGSLESAIARIRKIEKRPLSSSEVAGANIILDELQRAKRWDEVDDFIEFAARKATENGQAVQAYSLYGRLTPVGALRYTNKLIADAKRLVGVNSSAGRALKLTDEAKAAITKQAEATQQLLEKGMDGTREFTVESAKLIQLMRQQIPPTLGEQLRSYTTISLLSGFKTFERNILGSLSVGSAETLAKLPANVLDRVASIFTGQRTTGINNPKTVLGGALRGSREGIQDVRLGIDTSGDAIDKFNLGYRQGPTFGQLDAVKNKIVGRTATPGITRIPRQVALSVLARAEKAVNYSIRVPDRAAFAATFAGELESLKRVAPDFIPESVLTEEALLSAQRVTLQDPNLLSKTLSGFRSGLNSLTGSKHFGLGEAVMKFTQVPGALVKRFIEYSPLGLVDTFIDLRRTYAHIEKPAVRNWLMQRRAVQGLGRTAVGSTTIAAGAALGSMGIITGKKSTDKDIAGLEEKQGFQEYSINIDALKRFILGGFDPEAAKQQGGDRLVNFDLLQPLASSLMVGVDVAENGKDGLALNIANAIAQSSNSIFDQPVFSGTQSLIKSFQYEDSPIAALIASGMSVPSQFVPTLASQFRYLTDDTIRESYGDQWYETALMKILNRIPWLSQNLPAEVDVLGDPKRIEGGKLNTLLNPFYTSTIKEGGVAGDILQTVRASGESGAAPRVVGNSVNLPGDVKIPLDTAGKSRLQQLIGSATKVEAEKIYANPQFLLLNETEKAKVIKEMISDVYNDVEYVPYIESLGIQVPPNEPATWAADVIKALRGKNNATKAAWDALSTDEKREAITQYLAQ